MIEIVSSTRDLGMITRDLCKTQFQLGSDNRMFPNFRYTPGMEVRSVYSQLNSKYVQRRIMEGGPLVQPQEFYALLTHEDLHEQLERELNGHLEDRSLDPMFLSPSHVIYLDQVVERILSGSLRLPIVFKPNFGAFGKGIYFISKSEKGGYEIVVQSPRQGLNELGIPSVLRYIMDNLEFSDQGNIFSALIRDDTTSAQLLRDLIIYGTVTETPFVNCFNENEHGEFDPGLIESFVDAWKFEGLAYETRHRVEGNLAERAVFKVVDDYARIGGSRYFANLSSTRDRSRVKNLPSNEMYSPLFSAFKDSLQENRFRFRIREILEAAFLYYAERLFDEGFVFESDKLGEFQFDLMWIQPSEEGGLPIPVLVEGAFRYFNPLSSKLKYRFECGGA